MTVDATMTPSQEGELVSTLTNTEPLLDQLGFLFIPSTLCIVLRPQWSSVTVIGPGILPSGAVDTRKRFIAWGVVGVDATHHIPMPAWVTEAAIDTLRASADRKARPVKDALKALSGAL